MASTNKVVKKAIKQARSLSPRKSTPAWKKALPGSGGIIAGAVGTYVMSKAAKKVEDKVRGAGGFQGAVNKAQEAVGLSSTGSSQTKLRDIIQEYVDIGVPRRSAFNSWSQWEQLSDVFKGVEWVSEEDADVLKWTAKIGPSRRQWEAEITDEERDRRVQWESRGGTENFGAVTFHSLDDGLTRIMVEMEYHPNGFLETTANLLRVQRRRVRRDLRLFKHFVELKSDEKKVPPKSSQKDEQKKSAPQTDEDSSTPLEDLTAEDLHKIAGKAGLEGHSKMTKAELVEALSNR
jgi:uncharacterized membrane protein